MIEVNCFTGKTLKLSEIELYPERLKKHSLLEIDRLEKSILKDGLCFPLQIGKVDGHNYIIDGEATYLALMQIASEEIPEIPVVLIKCNAETIKRRIIMSVSTNHCLFKGTLETFCEGTSNIDLREFSFSEGTLINFIQVKDIDRYFESIPNTNKVIQEKYVGLLGD